jgi:hypothetical protein
MENDGWTVAHEAAKFGHLPADFSQWELPDKHGDTVAYIALTSDMLPISFNKWSALINSAGEQTLLELLSKRVSLRYYNCNIMTFQSIWRTEKPLCKTDEDWVIFKKVLPEVYSKYSALDCFDVAQDELFDML